MKGVVFTEFVEMVEKTFSPDVMDELFDAVPLESGGAYTSVGTYDHRELVALVGRLSQRTGVDVPTLIHAFGKHLMREFAVKFPEFFEVESAFDFLERVDGCIHVEVRKLYPDAELPQFTTERVGDDRLSMLYVSERSFEDLAHGLIEGAIEHFGEAIDVERESRGDGIRFLLQQRAEVPACAL